MSIKSTVFAAAAALTLAGGLAAAGTLPAKAATPECGAACVDLFTPLYVTHRHPLFVLGVRDHGEATGTPVVLLPASDTNPGEDFTINSPEPVSAYIQIGVISAALERYSAFEAFEIQYAPYGAPTGECVGIPAAAGRGTRVSLQPCGVSSKTLWIEDSSAPIDGSSFPLINGSDTNASTPYVLTYPSVPYSFWFLPGRQLQTSALVAGRHRRVPANQLWSADLGVLKNSA